MLEKNKIVYLYGFSHTNSVKFRLLSRIIQNHSESKSNMKIIFIHDAVIAISKRTESPEHIKKLLNLPIEVYALIPDMKARGLNPESIIDNVNAIEYDQLVDILVDSEKIVSWV